MTTVSVEEAQSRLPELIDGLRPGEELVIVRDEKPVAALVGRAERPTKRAPGSARGKILYMAEDFDAPLPESSRAEQFGCMRDVIGPIPDDFDAPLEDFREYME